MAILITVLTGLAILAVLYAAYMYKGWVYFPKLAEDSPVPPVLVAHAGGGIDGQTYTNSLEAMDLSYSLGHRVIEVDFCWSSDGRLVLMHEWEVQWVNDFVDAAGIPTYDQFPMIDIDRYSAEQLHRTVSQARRSCFPLGVRGPERRPL